MKPHDPKYPSPHEKTPKPTVWKSEKTPKPTVWKTPKPTKAEKTPKPTWMKTPKPTKAEKTPKPTWHKDEKTPKPTVWKSDETPKPTAWKNDQYSMNDEEPEEEGNELQTFNNCPCFEGGRCVDKKRDWLGVPYCPAECIGSFADFLAGRNGTC